MFCFYLSMLILIIIRFILNGIFYKISFFLRIDVYSFVISENLFFLVLTFRYSSKEWKLEYFQI